MSASFSAQVLRRVLALGGVNQQVPVQTATIDATIASHTATFAALAPFTQAGTAAPTTGAHVQGEFVWNTAPAAAGTLGWSCVTAGTPGTWKTVSINA